MDILTLNTKDRNEVLRLYRTIAKELAQRGIRQWDRFYPNRFVVANDFRNQCLFGVRDGGRLLAVVAVNGEQSRRYASVDWADAKGNPAVIHRLAVHPDLQGRGLGLRLLQFAEHQARSKGCSSVRLDVYSDNEHAVRLYERHGYSIRGEIRFPFRPAVYYAMEKSLP